MCTDVTHKDFITAHHELAHIQYFLNYRHNPKVFRDGANPGNFLLRNSFFHSVLKVVRCSLNIHRRHN